MLTGQNGILNRASEAKEKTEVAQKDENEKMQGYEDIINKYTGNLPSKEETKPYFPSSTFSYKEGDLNTGLVINDSYGNEYVWVEVPKTTEVYSTAGISITNFTDEEYTKIENDLKGYTKDYSDENYNDTNPDFTQQYRNMLKSVYTNGGFWIGRYEAGYEENTTRTSHVELAESDKAVIKKNRLPWIYVTRYEAKILAERMNYGDCKGNLIFGIQWDLVLKYIEEKTVAVTEENKKTTVRTDIKNKLTSNSTMIGNYKTNLWNITNTNAKYSLNNGISFISCPYQKESEERVMLTTGADESFSLMNIYDIAGNVWEWTLEFGGTSYPSVNRGGSYYHIGSVAPAMNRYGNNINSSSSDFGFRVGLWK